MQIPHHGSLNNLSKVILDKLKPTIGIISADGSKHHPHQRLINCLRSRKTRLYTTNRNGVITIKDGEVSTKK